MKPNDLVLTLDAGGTNFVFAACSKGQPIGISISKPAHSKLSVCLQMIIDGFRELIASLQVKPVAISFAFPGPADYPNGVIGDLANLPAFRGGVALGPMLEDTFGVPVFINNDGDLFAYGEAIAGLLPYINNQLEQHSNSKRYRNLLGVTLGTGFGAGFVSNGQLFLGDNSAGAEIWATRSMLHSQSFAEEDISIRAVRRNYFQEAGLPDNAVLSPKDIFHIAMGQKKGSRQAALRAFELLGLQLGDSLANAITLLDCNVVIGGGLANAYSLFAPAMMTQLNGKIVTYNGDLVDRMEVKAFDLENESQHKQFLEPTTQKVFVPSGSRSVSFEANKKVGVGLSKLGTSNAIAVGAWAFAINRIEQ